jgi:hypothetical protein
MAMRLRLNQPMLKFPAGIEIEVPTGPDGEPSELFWRRRLRDARVDGCVTIVQPTPEPADAAPALEE